MSQQLAQRGTSNIMSGGTQFYQGFKGQQAIDAQKAAADKAAAEKAAADAAAKAAAAQQTPNQITPTSGSMFGVDFNNGVDPVEAGLASAADMIPLSNEVQFAEGMVVEDLLGELNRQNQEVQNQEQGGVVQKTPGEFNHDTNDMILMAPTERGLVDTGIRQTGGEFVLNPEQAEGLEEAYENVNRKKPTYEQLLALYEAARFLDEPQFDDDYVA